MNRHTLARAKDLAKILEARAALRAECDAVGLTPAMVAKRMRRHPSLVSHFFRGAPSERTEQTIRTMLDERRDRRAS